MKKISVIIPCFNVEKYIDRCLSSVFSQSFPIDEVQVICVDDGSLDDTFQKLSLWEKDHPYITIIGLDSNKGQSTARNIALSYADGEFVAFIDADDWIDQNYLKAMYDIAVSGQYDIVQCDFVRDSENSTINPTPSVTSHTDGISILIDSKETRKKIITTKTISSNAPMKLIKRSLLTNNAINFNDGLRYEDIAFGLLLTMYAKNVFLLKDKLYHYCINGTSTVLKKNETYHTDLIANWDILWTDLHDRNLFESYKDEFELEFVYSCVVIFWKILAFRFDDPPYSLYVLLAQKVKRYIPNIMENPYIRNNRLSELHMLLLNCCMQDLDESAFRQVIGNIRKIGL